MSTTPLDGVTDFVAGLPELVQPVIIAALGMIPYVEGEGSAAIGIVVGVNPVVAALAGAVGNILSVVAVVLLSSRLRESVVSRRASSAEGPASVAVLEEEPIEGKQTRRAKGQKRLKSWVVRYGVPGASILAPVALPTQFTAAFLVGTGVPKGWVLLWQMVAIVLWTALVAAVALGIVTLFAG